MNFDPARIGDPEYFAENRVDAHSDHRWFRSLEEARTGESSFEQCLNGLWKFHYAKHVQGAISGFESTGFDCSDWDDIPVPAHIQLHGYDRPQYVNFQYPWDGHEPVAPGQVPQRHNPVASYTTTFELDSPLTQGEQVTVVFHGAESALAVWLNGQYIGYAADSFTPSEFDLTEALVSGTNKLAVQVFRFSAGSWIEDQDAFRFSGLFRDVVLHRRPAVHVADIRVVTELSEQCDVADVAVTIQLTGLGSAQAWLTGVGGLSDEGALRRVRVEHPRLWSDEDPFLHELVVEVRDDRGELSEIVVQKVGIRRFAIEGGLLRINGRRIVFKGVNRPEFGLRGRVMTRAETEADIRLMKAVGINAVRTSHYPSNSFFYDLCDEYGLYVIDEMNLESHGLWDLIRYQGAAVEDAVPGDRPEWRAVLLDRAASMLERDKNHPCVVMWSCGNESFGGSNILAVADWFRERDNRPVHYEGIHWDDRHPTTSDVVSQMYTPASEVEEYLSTRRDKPFILCEFAHAMGNSFGGVGKYLDLAYREPLFQGGFIWDFADQALLLTDRHGQEFFGYGGDFGDAPNDSDFSANGILFADHTPSPKLAEVKRLFQCIHIEFTRDSMQVQNRSLFTPTSAYDCVLTLAREGRPLESQLVETDVAPGACGTYDLPFAVPDGPGEYVVEATFRLRTGTAWAQAGHDIASAQAVFGVPHTPARTHPRPELINGMHNVGVRGPHFMALFSKLHGGLVSYRYGLTSDGGREMLSGMPRPNFWHAPTSNERGWDMPRIDGQWLLASRYAKAEAGLTVRTAGEHIDVGYVLTLPTAPASSCDLRFRIAGDGRIEVTLDLHPGAGLPDPPEFGMLITTDAQFDRLRWYGEGPHECYVDRRDGARLAIHEGHVATQLTRYVRPQEAGNHTGVRWAEVTNGRGAGLRFDCEGSMELSATPWTPFEIENAAHPVDLPPIQRTVVRPALMRRGVGGDDSWGARTHPEFLLPAAPLRFRFGLRGLG